MALHYLITKLTYKIKKMKINKKNNICSPNVLTKLDSGTCSLAFLKPKVFIARPDKPELSHELHAI